MEIFISYRREDTSGYALGFRREFANAFPDATVFLDVDSIEPGVRWRDAIRERIRSCDVMLVLMGDEWLRRRDDVEKVMSADDTVRFELEEALARSDIVLIPVLVEGARMPPSSALPAEVRAVCDVNAQVIHDQRYDQDLKELIERLAKVAAGTRDEKISVSSLPSRVTGSYLAEVVPGMGRDRLLELIAALRDRGWSNEEIYDDALSLSPFAPPKSFPGRITPAWLADNVPLMNPQRVPKLVHELRRRRWTDDDIRRSMPEPHPALAINEVPSRVYPAWLERNAGLMTPDFQRKLARVLLDRGWSSAEVRDYLFYADA